VIEKSPVPAEQPKELVVTLPVIWLPVMVPEKSNVTVAKVIVH
jgi:hypothetical protein